MDVYFIKPSALHFTFYGFNKIHSFYNQQFHVYTFFSHFHDCMHIY